LTTHHTSALKSLFALPHHAWPLETWTALVHHTSALETRTALIHHTSALETRTARTHHASALEAWTALVHHTSALKTWTALVHHASALETWTARTHHASALETWTARTHHASALKASPHSAHTSLTVRAKTLITLAHSANTSTLKTSSPSAKHPLHTFITPWTRLLRPAAHPVPVPGFTFRFQRLPAILSHCPGFPVSLGYFGRRITILFLLPAKLLGPAPLACSACLSLPASLSLFRITRSFLSNTVFNSNQQNCCYNA
jgi:hypothetical protein